MSGDFHRFIQDQYGLREPFMLHPEKEHGKNHYRYDFGRPFHEYMKQQNCPWVTPHIMRHTFASLLASMDPMLGGPSDFEIATWMGIDLRTYQRTYAKIRPAARRFGQSLSLRIEPRTCRLAIVRGRAGSQRRRHLCIYFNGRYAKVARCIICRARLDFLKLSNSSVRFPVEGKQEHGSDHERVNASLSRPEYPNVIFRRNASKPFHST